MSHKYLIHQFDSFQKFLSYWCSEQFDASDGRLLARSSSTMMVTIEDIMRVQ